METLLNGWRGAPFVGSGSMTIEVKCSTLEEGHGLTFRRFYYG